MLDPEEVVGMIRVTVIMISLFLIGMGMIAGALIVLGVS